LHSYDLFISNQAELASFDFVSKVSLQTELVEVLQLCDQKMDFERFDAAAYEHKPLKLHKDDDCCIVS
jgi:hypothetical protein